MSGYIPTTEEWREFVTRPGGTGSSLAIAQAEAIGVEFDRYVLAERQRVADMATKKERERFLQILAEEEAIGELILKRDDCNADCYKCEISGHTTIKTVKRLRERIENG